MLSKVGKQRRTRGNVDTTDILMGDITGKKFEDRAFDEFDNDNEFHKIQDIPSISPKDQQDLIELRGVFSREIETLRDEFKETTIKLREVENHLGITKDEVIQRRQEVLQTQMDLEQITQHLDMLKQESEVLKIWHVDSQAENEGLRIMKEISTAWKEGLEGRNQLLNFDEILKGILPEDKTVQDLLNERRPDLWSIFNPLIDPEKQKLKHANKSKIQAKSAFKAHSLTRFSHRINRTSSKIVFHS
ncbi:DgyrCDS10908 [Dimorphilus gyrociliatus]|uniref:DgyrCDS10908 n=1 Tax=Dimorphilus gyrociliatus TaxID=2664684 RepID=A0A7I8W1U3_9ANNE|nr:DgyrCDS10908 [Dimorphilus gyrociliatus]